MKARKKRQIPTTTHHGIQIREVRPNYWMVDLFRDGKRDRVCFDNLDAAKTHCEIIARKVKNEGTAALALSPDQRRDAAKAISLINGRTTLTAIAEHWLKQNPGENSLTVAGLADRFMKAVTAAGCRATTLRDRGHKVGRLVSNMGDRPVAALTKNEIVALLDSYKLIGSTRDGYRRCFHAMWQNGIREGLLQDNIIAQIPAIRGDERMPTPLTVEATRAILNAAVQYAPIMVPTLAVQFFAGLRPGEALGLLWQQIDFDEKIIRITPESSKMRRSRLVDMDPALLAWLAPYRREAGTIGITTQNQFHYTMMVKECAGKKGLLGVSGVEWIQDGPRKTFASMHYAAHQNAAMLAAILGHTGGVDILFRHYRGLVKKTEAAKYWALRPPTTDSKVIQMPKAASDG